MIGIDADDEGRGDQVIGAALAKEPKILRVVQRAVENGRAVQPAAAGHPTKRDDEKHDRRHEEREQRGGQAQRADEKPVACSHPQAARKQEREDGQHELDRALVGKCAETIPAPVRQLDPAAGPGAPQDFIRKAEWKPEGGDVEGEDERECGLHPRRGLSGKVAGCQRDQEGIDQKKTAKEDLGEPMGIGQNLAKAVFLVAKTRSVGRVHAKRLGGKSRITGG